MRLQTVLLAGAGMVLAGCNTTQSGSPTAANPASGPAVASADAQQPLPPIYEPLVDMRRVNPAKYQRDLAECRQQAAPQEAARAPALREDRG